MKKILVMFVLASLTFVEFSKHVWAQETQKKKIGLISSVDESKERLKKMTAIKATVGGLTAVATGGAGFVLLKLLVAKNEQVVLLSKRKIFEKMIFDRYREATQKQLTGSLLDVSDLKVTLVSEPTTKSGKNTITLGEDYLEVSTTRYKGAPRVGIDVSAGNNIFSTEEIKNLYKSDALVQLQASSELEVIAAKAKYLKIGGYALLAVAGVATIYTVYQLLNAEAPRSSLAEIQENDIEAILACDYSQPKIPENILQLLQDKTLRAALDVLYGLFQDFQENNSL